jgi:5-formyltetrahydrofolate cyclo-ligase
MNGQLDPNDDKVRRRRHWRALRDGLPTAQREASSEAIGQHLRLALQAWVAQRVRRPLVAVYWPINSEPNLLPLWREFLSTPDFLQLALPVVLGSQQALKFVAWEASSALRVDRYGIQTPIADPQTPSLVPDLIVAPCLAFNHEANGILRLGYGGGFYDRTLSQLHCPLWGVAFDETLDTALAAQAHDQMLARLFTPGRPQG